VLGCEHVVAEIMFPPPENWRAPQGRLSHPGAGSDRRNNGRINRL